MIKGISSVEFVERPNLGEDDQITRLFRGEGDGSSRGCQLPLNPSVLHVAGCTLLFMCRVMSRRLHCPGVPGSGYGGAIGYDSNSPDGV